MTLVIAYTICLTIALGISVYHCCHSLIQLLVCTSFMLSVNPYLHMYNIFLRTCKKLI